MKPFQRKIKLKGSGEVQKVAEGFCPRCLKSTRENSGLKCDDCGCIWGRELGGRNFLMIIPRYHESPEKSFSKLMSRLENIFDRLEESVNNASERSEKDLKNSPDADVLPLSHERRNNNKAEFCLNVVKSRFGVEIQDWLASDAAEKYGRKKPDMMKQRAALITHSKGMFGDFNQDSVASYHKVKENVAVTYYPKTQLKSFDEYTGHGLASALLQGITYMGERNASLPADICHEMTHAFNNLSVKRVNNGLDLRDKKYPTAIDEGAAWAVSWLWYEEIDMSIIDNYRDARVPKSLLQNSIRAFLKATEAKNGKKEKIDEIRQISAEVLQEIATGDVKDPIELIKKHYPGIEEFYSALNKIERLEYFTSHLLLLYGFIDQEKFRKWSHEALEDQRPYEVEDNFGEKELSSQPKEDRKESVQEEIKNLERISSKLSKLLSHHELEDELVDKVKRLVNDINRLEKLWSEERKELKHPFCGSCGGLLNPGSNYCPNCGNHVDRKDTEKLSGLIDETYKISNQDVLFEGDDEELKKELEKLEENWTKIVEQLKRYNNAVSKVLSDTENVVKDLEKSIDRSEILEEIKSEKREIGELEKTASNAEELISRAERQLEK
jgi:predicted RNA-binding Zn-ribbon protein involved in translation (DUF1610 family)